MNILVPTKHIPFLGTTLTGSGVNCGVTPSRSRSFDVSSLIGLSDTNPTPSSKMAAQSYERSGSCSPPPPAAAANSKMAPPSSQHPSPNVSLGPPAPPPPPPNAAAAALYPFLMHPGLYQHLVTGMNPMLALQIQSNPMAAAAYAANFHASAAAAANPALLHLQAERLRAAAALASAASSTASTTSSTTTATTATSASSGSGVRYSPYPLPSPPTGSNSLHSPTNATSAFHSVKKISASDRPKSCSPSKSPISSEAATNKRPPSVEDKEKDKDGEAASSSDIKSMENLVNGLNGSSASKFGINHDQSSNARGEISA